MTLKTAPSEWGQLLLPLVNADVLGGWEPRYNIAPTQDILAVASDPEDHSPALDYFRWGLVPGWASDLSIGNRMINARMETLPEKRSFSGPLNKRRCLIIADGYYEWQKMPNGKKQPWWITPAKQSTMLIAGLWETNRKATGTPIRTCTIITTSANQSLSQIHDRMPIVLEFEAAEKWLDQEADGQAAYSLLQPIADDYFSMRQVSTYVNNARHEGQQCIEEVQSLF